MDLKIEPQKPKLGPLLLAWRPEDQLFRPQGRGSYLHPGFRSRLTASPATPLGTLACLPSLLSEQCGGGRRELCSSHSSEAAERVAQWVREDPMEHCAVYFGLSTSILRSFRRICRVSGCPSS